MYTFACVYVHIHACRDVIASVPHCKGFAFSPPPPQPILECKLQGAIEPQVYLAVQVVSGRDPSRLMWNGPILGSVTGAA